MGDTEPSSDTKPPTAGTQAKAGSFVSVCFRIQTIIWL